MSRVDYEYEFDPDAPNITAASVYRLAREGGTRVLDLGSGPGIVAGALVTIDGKVVTCVDSDPDLLDVAKARGASRIFVADLNDSSWMNPIATEQFDVLILADVLEHLYDPAQLLRTLYDSSLVADGGRLIISIPNAAHEGALAELVSGNFTYTPTGILDETHLRFFTLNSFQALVESAGFFISHIERTLRTIEQTSFRDRLPDIPAGLRRLVAEHNPEVHVYQYVMQLVPAREKEVLAGRRSEIESLKAKVAGLEIEISKKDKDVAQVRASTAEEQAEVTREASRELEAIRQDLADSRKTIDIEHREVQRLQKELQRLRSSQVKRFVDLDANRRLAAQELEQARAANQELERRERALEKRIDVIYASNTWRVGDRIRRLTAPFNRKSAGDPRKQEGSGEPKPTEIVQTNPMRALARHPLADDYLDEVAAALPQTGTSLAFVVHTSEFDEGRGDVFVAVGLGRQLRRMGLSPVYVPERLWYDIPDGVNWLVAMLPSYNPRRAPKGTRVIGWVRNEVDNWLQHPELDLFDAVLCSSEVARASIAERYAGPTGVLPIGVDLDLFGLPSEAVERAGVVSTVNQWGRERDIYRALRSSRITFPLDIYGKAVGLPAEIHEFHRGLVDFFSLPGLYQGAVVVLDDFNHTTVGWGAVNSRVFEAIAAGALPITNSSLGMKELGLDELPVFSDPEELNSKVSALLSDRDSTSALAERLRRVVEERHSFDRRARELSEFLSRVAVTPGVKRALGYYPDYRVSNPYQDMLYSSRREYSTAAVPLQTFTDLSRLIPERDGATRVFHLHWTAPITGPAESESEALARVDEFLVSVQAFQAQGGRFVWTVHNALPHELQFEDVELHLRNELAMRADLIHVMCDATLALVHELYGLPEERTIVIPHSGYVGIYPDGADRETARRNLGLDKGDIALIAFGGIRPYKRIDWLLDALDKALEAQPRLRLIVAGKPGRFPGIRDLQERCDSHPAVIANFNEIAPQDLQHFYKAADVAVLTHGAALNSGALLLAYSFGCPVIAPRSGCLDEGLAGAGSIGFDSDDFDGLVDALANADQLVTTHARQAARAYAEARPVADMSGAFLKSLDTLDR